MPILSPSDADRAAPLDFWRRVSEDQTYSPDQRAKAREWYGQEQAWTGTDRSGLSFRGLDEFNRMGGSQPLQPSTPSPVTQSAQGAIAPSADVALPGAVGANTADPNAAELATASGLPGTSGPNVSPPPPPPPAATTGGQAPPPGAVDPFAASGGGIYINGGWIPKNNPAALAAAGYTGSTSTTTTTGTGNGTALGSSGIGSNVTAPTVPGANWLDPNDPMYASLRQNVLDLLGTDWENASITDPDLAPQATTYSGARQRQARDEYGRQQERLATQGLGQSGASDIALRQGLEQQGQDIAAYNANLVGQKLNDRRDMLIQGIQTATTLGMSEEANQLQRELAQVNAQIATNSLNQGYVGQDLQWRLANLDTNTRIDLANLNAQLTREGYGTQERLAIMDNELRKYGIDVQGNLGLLSLIVNSQFNYDQLGANVGMFLSGLNQNAVINGLNG
jgi:hypothetical protein